MGLLDDAIREHLELKRRHGADPGEIERQEHEALGSPAGRAEADDAGLEPETEASTGEATPAPYDDAAAPREPEDDDEDAPGAIRAEDFAADAATTVYVPPDVEPGEAPPPAADVAPPNEVEPPAGEDEPPAAGHEAGADGYDEDPWLDRDETEAGRPGSREATPEDAAPQGEDDVLEETPDFLQETPEHDRLWFEQKPPRNFDWDR